MAGYHPSSGYYVIGEIVRRLGGQPFDRYVRKAIFAPLGMMDWGLGLILNSNQYSTETVPYGYGRRARHNVA